MTSMALTSDVPDFALYSMGGTPWQRPDEYAYRSPLTYLPSVSTPVLVVHWEGDLRVPIGQGEELYSGLRMLGKEAELLRYPGGFHASRSPSQAVDMTKQIIDFNRRHDSRVRG
jgi:dipeptidyl aminopeptidase/acylaminoacyl peptidase